MKNRNEEYGLLSLEASIVLTVFIFFMLFMYSFFVFFEARNEMAHVLLSTCDSLSFDIVENGSSHVDNVSALFKGIYGYAVDSKSSGFTNRNQWTNADDLDIDKTKWNGTIDLDDGTVDSNSQKPDEYGNVSAQSNLLMDVVRERFVAYLAGGDDANANEILKKYHIKGGINGISFSGSCVKSGELYLCITYDIEYEWNMFGLGVRTIQQSCCSKIWK